MASKSKKISFEAMVSNTTLDEFFNIETYLIKKGKNF